MVSRTRLLICCALLAARSAEAKGWDLPAYGLELGAFGTSEAFPGSLGSGPDRGLEARAQVSSGVRLSGSAKLGMAASGGGHMQQEFTKGNYGWLGLAATLRRHRLTCSLEGEWTPRRNKFPTDPEEGGEYHGASLTGGVRRLFARRARLRFEGTVERERFLPQGSHRNGIERELFAQAAFTPAGRLELHGEGSVAHDDVAASRYTKDTHWLGAGGAWSDSLWRADLSTRSGVRRYPDAGPGDSNFQRRDQWIELRLRVTRGLRPGLGASAGATLVDQTSSRMDRNYTYGTLALGLEWTGGGR